MTSKYHNLKLVFYNICLTLMTIEKKNMVIKDFLITQYEFKEKTRN